MKLVSRNPTVFNSVWPTFGPLLAYPPKGRIMARIDTVDSRNKLKPRTEPYWVKLSSGCMLGFRKMTPSSTGSWIARYRCADTGKRDKRSLGDFDDKAQLNGTTRPSGVQRPGSRIWGKGGSSEVVSVSSACMRYVKHVRANRGNVPADDLEMRFKRWGLQRPRAGQHGPAQAVQDARGKLAQCHGAHAGQGESGQERRAGHPSPFRLQREPGHRGAPRCVELRTRCRRRHHRHGLACRTAPRQERRQAPRCLHRHRTATPAHRAGACRFSRPTCGACHRCPFARVHWRH